jgi:hypothetical protein
VPVTPFHFGPGAALKAVAPVSFTVFAFTQCLIDLEPVTLYLLTGDPAHPYLHTYAGALLVALAGVWPGRPLCEWLLRAWNARLSADQAWLAATPVIGRREAIAGALLGAWSHVFIDSFMHHDVRPFRPLSDAGGMAGLIEVETLQWICVAAGAAGVALLAYRLRQRNHSQQAP